MTLTPGQTLQGRYRIDSLLGQGGMGAVYRGIDQRFDAPVAIKVNQLSSPESEKQFGREASLLHRLRHANLPRVTDHFTIPGRGQYLVMDYIEGQDLRQVVSRQGALPEAQSLAWMVQVLDALQYLHGEGIIHRDVKPANVKITPTGQVFLVDFGLAKEYDPLQQTTMGARGVTPGFAPPEQYGHGRTDARTDVYSAGATLYALLTGQEPPDALEQVTRQAALLPPRQRNTKVSPQVDAAVMRAMQAAPGDRYQSAAAFRAALREPGARQAPAQVPPPQVLPSAAKQPRKASKPVAVQAQPKPKPPPRRQKTKQKGKVRPKWFWPVVVVLLVLIVLCLCVTMSFLG